MLPDGFEIQLYASEPDIGKPINITFDAKGRTFLDAVMLGVGDVLRSDPRTFVYGEDVGGKYGNAFLLLRPLLAALPAGHLAHLPAFPAPLEARTRRI